MRVTRLEISPRDSWSPASDKNPLRARIRVEGDKTTIEVDLGDETMRRMLDLVAAEISAAAAARVGEFCRAVDTVEHDKGAALIGESA